MKKIFVTIIATLFVCTLGFSAGLIPAQSEFCRLGPTSDQSCPENREFHKGHDGRCGCLLDKDIIDPQTCIAAFIKCPEDAPYTSLNDSQGNYAGCGCFYTIE